MKQYFGLLKLSVSNLDLKKPHKAFKKGTQLKQNIDVPRCILVLFEAKDKNLMQESDRPAPDFPEQ